jgi:hypothetical protein
MSLITEVIKYCKDIVLLGERVDALMVGRNETAARLEDRHNRIHNIAVVSEPQRLFRGIAPPTPFQKPLNRSR